MQPPNSKRIPRHSAILLSLLSIVTTSAQTDPELPAETLHWDLTALEQDSGAVWSTATFQTLRGALYHLQSSPNLGEWQSVNSFYAIGSELQIALFESEPATVPLGGGNPPEPAEVIPFVSFMIRASADGTQTIVTWPSVSPDSEASPSVSALISAPPCRGMVLHAHLRRSTWGLLFLSRQPQPIRRPFLHGDSSQPYIPRRSSRPHRAFQ